MEFSEVFGFLKILSESIKLLPKNGKLMASITTLSLLLPSILILLLSSFCQLLTTYMTNSITKSSGPDSGYIPYQYIIIYFALLLFVEIAFLLAYIVISHSSGIATILVSAMSYTGRESSVEDLFSTFKRTWRRQIRRASFRRSKNPTRYAWIAVVLAASLAILHANPLTITIAIVLGISAFVSQLYASVAWALSAVVSVVEESREWREALEKAEKLVKGQRLHGFMLNLSLNLLLLIMLLGFWIILGDKGYLNLTTYGLFIVNSFSLAKIFDCMLYTMLYFQCKKYHGDEIGIPVIFQYNKLPHNIP